MEFPKCKIVGQSGPRNRVSNANEHPCFREFSHRIGSSLQTISSLARRAEREIVNGADEATAVAALRMVQRNVAAIAYIQRLLYINGEQPGAMRELVETLSDHLKTIYDRPDIDVVVTEVADVPTFRAQTIGLVLCELITNALRHGYDKGDPGKLTVAVTALPPGTIRLVVTDDGKGSVRAPVIDDSRGLGLVRDFVADACGDLQRLPTNCGLAWQVDLPF